MSNIVAMEGILRSENRELQRQIKELKAEREKCTCLITRNTFEACNDNEKEEVEWTLGDVRDNLLTLEKEKQTLENDLEQIKEGNNILKVENKSLEENILRLEKKNDELSAENRRIDEIQQEAKNEFCEERKQLASIVKDLEDENEKLQSHHESLICQAEKEKKVLLAEKASAENKLTKEMDNLQILANDKGNLENDLKRLEYETRKSREDKEKLMVDFHKVISENEEFKYTIQQLEKQKDEVEAVSKDLNQETDRLKHDLEDAETRYRSASKMIEVLQGKLQNASEEHKHELERKDQEINELQEKMDVEGRKWKKELFDAENEMKVIKAENEKVQRRIEEFEAVSSDLNQEIDSLKHGLEDAEARYRSAAKMIEVLEQKSSEVEVEHKHEIERKDQEINELIEKMEEERIKWKKELFDAENDMKVIKDESEKLQRRIEDLEEKLKQYETPIPVHLSVARGVGEYNEAAHALLEKVKDNLIKHKIDLFTQEISERGSDEKEAPMVVFCLNSSRLGTDVDATYNKQVITKSVRSALVIFNHRPKHNTKVTPSESLLGNPTKEKNLIDMVTDCVYWSADGFHDCDLNEEAVKNISLYIRKKMVK